MIDIKIPFNDPAITWQFARSSGPGGQNVNKTESKVILYFDARKSPNLSDDQKRIIYSFQDSQKNNPSLNYLQNKTTAGGKIMISNQESTSRDSNRQKALEILNKLLSEALDIPKERKIGLTKKAKATHRANIQKEKFLKFRNKKYLDS